MGSGFNFILAILASSFCPLPAAAGALYLELFDGTRRTSLTITINLESDCFLDLSQLIEFIIKNTVSVCSR